MLLNPPLPELSTERQLVLVMGYVQSGKTTAARKLGQQVQAPVVCWDALLHAITGGVIPQGAILQAVDLAITTVGSYLHHGRTVVYDAPNLSRVERARLLEVARYARVPVLGVLMQCHPLVRKLRIKERELTPAAVQYLDGCYETPQLAEGFAAITTLNSDPPEFWDEFVAQLLRKAEAPAAVKGDD